MVHSFKIEATKISFKKLDILIEQWTNKNVHIFKNISQSQWFTKIKLQLQSVFYPIVVSSLKVTKIQIVFRRMGRNGNLNCLQSCSTDNLRIENFQKWSPIFLGHLRVLSFSNLYLDVSLFFQYEPENVPHTRCVWEMWKLSRVPAITASKTAQGQLNSTTSF